MTTTPTPWRAVTETTYSTSQIAIEAAGLVIAHIVHNGAASPFAGRAEPGQLGDPMADARLMAAAPDLLGLLAEAVARVEIANAEGDPILSAWLPYARAAVDKAKRG